MQIVLDSCRQVVAQSRHVSLDQEALARFAPELALSKVPRWEGRYHFSGEPERLAHYLLLLDALNFCFWPEPRWAIDYQGEKISGYWALAAALKRAFEQHSSLEDLQQLIKITPDQLRSILGGTGEIPLLDERAQILRELGQVLHEKFQGQAARLFQAASGSAVELVRLLTSHFPSFRDRATYRGQPVYFYKRAQILAADLHEASGAEGQGALPDVDLLTAFADYKLPQVLRHLGILRYDERLAERVDARRELPAGSPEEIEIRAHTVWAVELLRREMERRDTRLHSFELDRLLWHLGQRDEFRAKPYHRTLTIYY